MQALIIRDTKQLDFPFSSIPEKALVEVVGTETEEGTIAIRFKGKTVIVKACDLRIVVVRGL